MRVSPNLATEIVEKNISTTKSPKILRKCWLNVAIGDNKSDLEFAKFGA